MKTHPVQTKSRTLSFEEAIVQRAAATRRHHSHKHHDTTAHDVAIDDGAPPALIHFSDVGPRGCQLS